MGHSERRTHGSGPAAAPVEPAVVAVVGATATGKSDLAVELALRLDGEVLNVDAMQVYRGMDVGTAKLSVSERRDVPHHLLDVWDVRDPASVARFQRLARRAIAEVRGRGRRPVLTGGSGLYLRATLDTLDFPGTDPELRAALEDELARQGPMRLHSRLAAADPAAARRIHPANARRVVRALEVVMLTGRPFEAALPPPAYAVAAIQVGLAVPRAELDARIERRVERMWRRGLLGEVAALSRQGLREGPTASRAIGYAQALAVLDGVVDEAQARWDTVRGTRKLARRQQSWFARDPRVRWVDSGEDVPPPEVLRRALAVVSAGDHPR